jgi:hypothetical protein
MELYQPPNETAIACFKNVNNSLNTGSYLEKSGGQSSNQYLIVVQFFQHQH